MEKNCESYLPREALFWLQTGGRSMLASALIFAIVLGIILIPRLGLAEDLCLNENQLTEPRLEILYLHGWLQDSPLYVESHALSLAALKKVSQVCNARIYVPKSEFLCKRRGVGTVRCWNRSQEGELDLVWQSLRPRLRTCLTSSFSRDVVAVGFSDGAYFLNHTEANPLNWKAIVISGLEPQANPPAVKIAQALPHSLSSKELIKKLQELGVCKGF